MPTWLTDLWRSLSGPSTDSRDRLPGGAPDVPKQTDMEHETKMQTIDAEQADLARRAAEREKRFAAADAKFRDYLKRPGVSAAPGPRAHA